MRLVLLAGALFLCAASAQPMQEGDVAMGGCPAGEDCSPDTPDGLLFIGQRVASDTSSALHPTAVGGVQRFDVQGAPGFFDVETDGDITAVVDDLDEEIVHVTAVGPNGGTLRVLDPDTGELYDRITLATAPITTAAFDAFTYADTLAVEEPTVFWNDSLSGARLTLRSGEVIVIDGAMSLERGETVSVAPLRDEDGAPVSYDSFEIGVGAPGAASLVVHAGGADHAVPVIVVEDTGEIRAVGEWSDPARLATVNGETLYCFTALTGGAVVAGAPWFFDPSPGLAFAPDPFLPGESCVALVPEELGPATLTVISGPTARTYDLEVTSVPMPKPAPRLATGQRPSARGDRASRRP